MKIIRIGVAIVLLFVVVCVVGLGSLFFFIDPNKLKPVIAEEVHAKTGYNVVIDGEFSWSFYPRVGVKVAHIALLSPGQKTPFIDLQDVLFVTQWSELLHGKQALRGDIYISSLALLKTKASNAHVGLHWKDNVLTLSPVTAALYDGTMTGVVRASQLSATPHWRWDVQLRQVQLKSLLQDLNGADSKLLVSGAATVTFQAESQGVSRDQILNNLNGAVVYRLSSGVLEGIDLNYFVQSADALINRKAPALPDHLDQTVFDGLEGASTIRNGMADIHTLTLTTPTVVAHARGSVNLMYQAMNLQLQLTSQQQLRTQWAIPVLVTGSVSKPDVRLDTTELNVMIAKQDLEKVKSKVANEAKRHLSPKAAQFVDQLLGQ